MSETVSPRRQRMIEDGAARMLNRHTQRSHTYPDCKRFAAAQTLARYGKRPTRCNIFSSTSSRAVRASVTAIASWPGALPVPRHAASPLSDSRDVAPQGAAEAAATLSHEEVNTWHAHEPSCGS